MGDDGVYYSEMTRRPRRAWRRSKQAAVGLAGLAAMLGGGSFLTTTVITGHDATETREPEAPAPTSPPARPRKSPSPVPQSRPPAGPQGGTKNGVRQAARPSPTPSTAPTPATAPTSFEFSDDDLVNAQVSRLLQGPAPAASGMTAASAPVTVAHQTGTDGSTIRVVSARYDLTGRWELLLSADQGQQVAHSRCTQNFRVPDSSAAQTRPGVLLCWRTSAAKSVVTIAIARQGQPSAAASSAAIDRAWAALG